jgi:hypothetical protein
VLNGRRYFEKITLNQFKKDMAKHRGISWSLDNEEQLYLLSRFPSFTGVRGSLVPIKKHSLPNHSGCLGSYGLLYKPGDFAFVSATRLSLFAGGKKTLKMAELHDLADDRVTHVFCWAPVLISPLWNIFGNCHFCQDAFNFVDEYLKMNVGEPVFMMAGMDSPQARSFLQELMSAIESKAKKEGDQGMHDFVKEFRQFPYENEEGQDRFDENPDFDFEGGGIGIIHTTIDLGE